MKRTAVILASQIVTFERKQHFHITRLHEFLPFGSARLRLFEALAGFESKQGHPDFE